ncbi:MAG: hypothetical protein IIB10_13285 [Chloroflexi bacterium]|nr:hypothetical protein [Chloroflexota bacterium]
MPTKSDKFSLSEILRWLEGIPSWLLGFLAGSFISIGAFALLFEFTSGFECIQVGYLEVLMLGLLGPAITIGFFNSSLLDILYEHELVLFAVSSIPYAFLGALIASRRWILAVLLAAIIALFSIASALFLLFITCI